MFAFHKQITILFVGDLYFCVYVKENSLLVKKQIRAKYIGIFNLDMFC